MKKMILYFNCILIVFLAFIVVCWGGNGWEDYARYKHQKQQDEREALKYDPYDDRWSYERPEATLKYNPYENEWQYKEKNETFKYNPYEDEWE